MRGTPATPTSCVSASTGVPGSDQRVCRPCGPGSAAGEEVEVGLGQGGRVLQRDVVTGRGDDDAADVGGHLRQLPGYLVAEIGLRADGQDRAADRVGVMWPVLLGV